MKNKASLSLVAAALALGVSASVYADYGQYGEFQGGQPFGYSYSSTYLSTLLTGTGNVGQGQIAYTANATTGASSFSVGITIPVGPTNTLSSTNAVVGAQVALSITNASGTYSCAMPITNVFWQYSPTATTTISANYQNQLVKANTATAATALVGSCVSGSSTTPVVPTINAGDTVTVTLNGAAFLTGTFSQLQAGTHW